MSSMFLVSTNREKCRAAVNFYSLPKFKHKMWFLLSCLLLNSELLHLQFSYSDYKLMKNDSDSPLELSIQAEISQYTVLKTKISELCRPLNS